MMTPIPYTITNTTITVIIDDEPQVITKGNPNFEELEVALTTRDYGAVPGLLTIQSAIQGWLKGASEDFQVTDKCVTYKGESLPEALNARILGMAQERKDPRGLLNFWTRLKQNPNAHSVQQLFKFLEHIGIPVQPDGTFLAYKGVQKNFMDCHSGTIDNSPGQSPSMKRSLVSSDPKTACHRGLHVGAISYAQSFGDRVVVVEVDPKDVVCVPDDASHKKMRTCRYLVRGLFGEVLSSTAFEADVPQVTPEMRATSEAMIAEEKVGKAEKKKAKRKAARQVEVDKIEAEITQYEVEASAKKAVAPKKATPTDDQVVPFSGTIWDNLIGLDKKGLMEISLVDLRKYALYNCQISGASKLPGGKEALVTLILKVCRNSLKRSQRKAAKVVKVEKRASKKVVKKKGPRGLKVPLRGTEWDHLNRRNGFQLLDVSLADLRKYASHNCLIVGASKMGGGKFALVQSIIRARGGR